MHQKTAAEIDEILRRLAARFPDAGCALDFANPFQLLVAVILSAQCTDVRVNAVTKELFKVYAAPADFAFCDRARLEALIYPCGFYKNKAESLISSSRDILEKFGGAVPEDYDSLLSLRGVGRKTANVVSAEAFKRPAIAVDTHVFRVSRRLGLSEGETPERVERDLMRVIPRDRRRDAHHLLIFHGRYRCKSQRPLCGECDLAPYCVYLSGSAKQG